jgi:hypothetical protein
LGARNFKRSFENISMVFKLVRQFIAELDRN